METTIESQIFDGYMTCFKSTVIPNIVAYLNTCDMQVTIEEINQLFSFNEISVNQIQKATNKETPRDVVKGCQRIKGDNSNYPGEPCGNKIWKNPSTGIKAKMCRKCMSLKSGFQLATSLANSLGITVEEVSGEFQFSDFLGPGQTNTDPVHYYVPPQISQDNYPKIKSEDEIPTSESLGIPPGPLLTNLIPSRTIKRGDRKGRLINEQGSDTSSNIKPISRGGTKYI